MQAARILSAVNIQLPLALGYTLAYSRTNIESLGSFWWLSLYGLGMQLYIVFLNDWADRSADILNQRPTIFSGGSRVLVQAKLYPIQLRNAGLVFGCLALIWGIALGIFFSRPLLPMLCLVGLGLLWLYSLYPAKLNYRFGGEVLQALGVGGLLPIVAFYFITGHLLEPDIVGFIFGYYLLQLAAAVAFTLPDVEADKESGKGTIAVHFGVINAVRISFSFSIVGILVLWFNSVNIKTIFLPLFGLLLMSLIPVKDNCWQRSSLFITSMLIFPVITFTVVFILSVFIR